MLAALLLALPAPSAQEASAEPLLAELPPGVFLRSSTALPAEQVAAIGEKLGGQLLRVSNSVLSVHGARIQVNVIVGRDEAQARAVEAALAAFKQPPFQLRDGATVIEYVGQGLSPELARKTSWELGFLPKPLGLHVRAKLEIAAVDEAAYMQCNPLFNAFLQWQATGGDAAAAREVRALAAEFTFGRSLRLRMPRPLPLPPGAPEGAEPARSHKYSFDPVPRFALGRGAAVEVQYAELPERLGVPYATVTAELRTVADGFRPLAVPPAAHLTAATAHWPADDPELRQLAAGIVGEAEGDAAKAEALLAWIAAGEGLRYAGTSGSRWGVQQALEQGFGHCWDFSDVFVTLARAGGLPARQVAGWLYGSSGHVWAEYYDAERGGWQQVDPTGGGVLAAGMYHLGWFVSEDGELPIVYLSMPTFETLAPAPAQER